ncbi:MAG: hypothetical protein HYZ57_20990 [Acidobacteria bacterium]|nr:hypothetical protein [Acidobacteriota bacterium]
MTEAVFDEIFRRHTAQNQIECEPDAAPDLRREIHKAGCRELRACLPADLCSLADWVRAFDQRSGRLLRSDLKRAVELYFANLPRSTEPVV